MADTPGIVIPDLRGKSVLITGASTGIGAAAARAFGRNGAKVAIGFNASRNEAERVAADVRAGTARHCWFKGTSTVRRRPPAPSPRPSRRSADSTCSSTMRAR